MEIFSVLLPCEKSYLYTYYSSYTWCQGESTCVRVQTVPRSHRGALWTSAVSLHTSLFPTLKARVCSSDDTHLFPVSTPVLLSTPVSPAPPPPALPWLAAARGSVISRLVIITELSWEQRRRERLRSSHRSQTATRSSGGCGRRWWPRSRWCGWRGCCRRRTSCWSRTRNISSPPDGHRAQRVLKGHCTQITKTTCSLSDL